MSLLFATSRLRVVVPVLGSAGCAVGLCVACFTAPPPDLPTQFHPPEIRHESLVPPEGVITELPQEFVVPVRLDDPSQSCVYSILRDGTPVLCPLACPQASADGGAATSTISFGVSPSLLDPSVCHEIRLVVATKFSVNQQGLPVCSTPSAAGGDVAIWHLDWPSCQTYEAGALDGAFPPDAAPDTLPIVPESGTDP